VEAGVWPVYIDTRNFLSGSINDGHRPSKKQTDLNTDLVDGSSLAEEAGLRWQKIKQETASGCDLDCDAILPVWTLTGYQLFTSQTLFNWVLLNTPYGDYHSYWVACRFIDWANTPTSRFF